MSQSHRLCFNEAAALHRGKLGPTFARWPTIRGFNEAAALHRGKRVLARTTGHHPLRFNEAAALHRGKQQATIEERGADRSASMRPRHYTAENPCMSATCPLLFRASMRPRHYTAENVCSLAPPDTIHSASMRPRHYTAENAVRFVKAVPGTKPLQ